MSHMVHSRSVRSILGDTWLLKLEKKAYGWTFWATEDEHEYGYEIRSDGSGHTTHKVIQRLEFRRPSPFSRNVLFNLSEVLSKIFSFFRRIFISIGFPALILSLIVGVVFSFLLGSPEIGDIGFEVAKWVAIGYGISVGGTFIFVGLGILWRKLFGIDRKLREMYGDNLAEACIFADEV